MTTTGLFCGRTDRVCKREFRVASLQRLRESLDNSVHLILPRALPRYRVSSCKSVV